MCAYCAPHNHTLSQHFGKYKTIDILSKNFVMIGDAEPVGSVGPRLTTGDKIRTADGNLNDTMSMMCPAQAFPVPFFR